MIIEIQNNNQIKEAFKSHFFDIIDNNPEFKDFLYDVFVEGTAFVIGGFLRDIIMGVIPRDLDLVVSVSYNRLKHCIFQSNLTYTANRFNGFKIALDDIEIDIWSIEDNWAFKENLVKRNDEDLLESIANGCFYNYDSLVINIHSMKMNIKNFRDFNDKGELDIIQRRSAYKKLNPTIEANILRAFYLKQKYHIKFTENCEKYLTSRIDHLQDKYGSAFSRLMKIRIMYPKYNNTLGSLTIAQYLKELMLNDGQGKLNF